MFGLKNDRNQGKVLVLGASDNPDRYGCKAVKSLLRNDFEVIPLGFKTGNIKDIEILTGKPHLENIDTVLLYIGANKQPEFYDYVVGLNPRRVIFNPGTENPEFQNLLREKGIQAQKDCALIMLNTGSF